MGGMFQVLRNAWKIPDLRRKLIFTVLMLIVYRIGSFIPVPLLDPSEFRALIDRSGGAIGGFLDIVSGGAFKNVTVFAMSIFPYVNASIIIQLLTVAIPRLERLAKEGEEGRKILAQYTRYATVLFAFLQATGLYFGVIRHAMTTQPSFLSFIVITFTFTAGTAFLMWLGEQITEHGIGNGISMIIFAGIVSRGPQAAKTIAAYYEAGVFGPKGILAILAVIGVLLVFLAVIVAVIWVQEAERRIPIQYAKRVVGRKMYGGQSTHLPIKVNMSGVMPIIFAMSIMSFPSTIVTFFNIDSTSKFAVFFKNAQDSVWYALIYAALIIFFTFFYTVIQFNPVEVANNIKKNGGFIPGLRPGKPTSDYIAKVLNRITWFGGFFLAFITLFPSVMGSLLKISGIWFGGTTVLILVGVALETVKQIESQMLMRHYKGFLE